MWKLAGFMALGLGVIGMFLPIVPTVPFILLAAYCFQRGSPELHRWLVEHPQFGPPLKDWTEHRVIRPRAKILAVSCIAASVGWVLLTHPLAPWLKVVVAGSCTLIVVFLLRQKSRL
jgi:uncharacterized protein